MAKASIHIEPIKSSSETHNKRLKEFDYIRKDLGIKNEKWEERSISEVRREIEEKYFRSVGQKMQKKAEPIREGVVLLKPEHTMEDLFRLKEKLYEELGIKTFQIYIHKDEGHWKKNEEQLRQHWTPNLHAHMVFDWTDEKGKSLRLNRKQMSLIQDIVSETLDMERGQRANVTGRKHLNPLEYKVKVMWEEIIQVKKKKEELKEKIGVLGRDKEELQEELQRLNSRYEEKHAEFERFFQSDINVSLFKKSVSNGFFGGKKEVINEEEIQKLIQNFSFSTEKLKKSEEKTAELKSKIGQLESQLKDTQKEKAALQHRINNPTEDYLMGEFLKLTKEKEQAEEKRKQAEEANRLRELHNHELYALTKLAVNNALDDYGSRVEFENIEDAFQAELKLREVPNVWEQKEIDRAINLELERQNINLEQQQEQQRNRGLRR